MLVRYEIRVAPGDLALLCALLSGTAELGSTSRVDTEKGRLEWLVPDERTPEVEAALRAVASWIPLQIDVDQPVAHA
jgi:hypothetical protein